MTDQENATTVDSTSQENDSLPEDRELSVEEAPREEFEPVSERPDLDFSPRGAFIFVMLMIAFYAVYWFAIWTEIVVIRGA